MKFLIDVHHIGSRATGNETWARETALAMQELLATEQSEDELYFAVAHEAGRTVGPQNRIDQVSTGQVRRLARDLPRVARQRHVDALLVQYTAPMVKTSPVVAIHDLSFADPASAAWIPPGERLRMNATIRISARHAARILALSHSTAQDMIRYWNVNPDKIVIAPPAVAPSFEERVRKRRRELEPKSGGEFVVLMVGNVLPRKNHIVVTTAIKLLRDRGLPVELRIAGQVPSAGQETAQRLRNCAGDWLTITGYLSDDQLIDEYLSADCLCFPSLYEGFGIPVLEAMAVGIPTIVSDATALPEAAGDAGIIVPPNDADAWADALDLVLGDAEVADRLRTAGRQRVSLFSWGATASHALQALRYAGG